MVDTTHRKTCTKCGVSKLLVEFRFTNKKWLTRRSECKSCEKEYKNTDQYKNKESSRYKIRRALVPGVAQKEKEHRDKYGATSRGRAVRLYLAAKHRAKVYNLEFNLVVEHIQLALMIGVCVRTGIEFDLSKPQNNKQFNPYAPSIDKIDPHRGYTFDNVVVVCNAYNIGKNQMNESEYVEFCKKVIEQDAKRINRSK